MKDKNTILAVYSPARDKLWCFLGTASIESAIADSRRKQSITFDLSKSGKPVFDSKWQIESPDQIAAWIESLGKIIASEQNL